MTVRRNLMRIVLIVGSLTIIVGVSLMTWMLSTEEERNVVWISIDDGDTEPIKFESLSLIPGDECEYTIKLMKEGSSQYDLIFDFVETGDGELKNFARVKIITQGNVVYDDLLVNALESENIKLPVDFDEGKNTEFDIVYYLPIDVGNEAKNAEAKFGLMLTASNE